MRVYKSCAESWDGEVVFRVQAPVGASFLKLNLTVDMSAGNMTVE